MKMKSAAPETNFTRPMTGLKSEVSTGMPDREVTRCGWAGSDLMIRYHDEEWGVPLHDDRGLFEFLCLEGAQAGLSWETVLRKRENYRAALADFDPSSIAAFTPRRLEKLLGDPGLIRNRLKLESTVRNARAFLKVQEEFGSFDLYIWRFVEGRPLVSARQTPKDLPARTPLSDAISKDLRKRGFNFAGSTICYAFMQAVGMVNDHLVTCFRYDELKARICQSAKRPNRRTYSGRRR